MGSLSEARCTPALYGEGHEPTTSLARRRGAASRSASVVASVVS